MAKKILVSAIVIFGWYSQVYSMDLFSSKGRGAGMAEIGFGAGAGQNYFDGLQDFNGTAGYLNAGFGKLFFLNVGASILLRADGDSGVTKANYQYNDIVTYWGGVGLNLGRLLLNVDLAVGEARHWYQDGGQTGGDYTKDKIENMMGYRAAVIIVPFTWGKANSICLTAQYMSLASDEFTRQTVVGGVVSPKTKIVSQSKSESFNALLGYMKSF